MSGRESEGSRRNQSSKSRGLGMAAVLGIIVALVVVILVIIMVLVGTSNRKKKTQCNVDLDCGSGKICRNGACQAALSCSARPTRPTPVTIDYDRELGDVVVLWGPVSGALGYKVYRKLGDPSVSKSNYDEVVSAAGTSRAFTGLATGTHYFAVVAHNECGDSDESSPVVLAPSCDVVPPAPGAPVITQTADNCGSMTEAIEINAVAHDEATGDNPFNIVRGDGQFGVADYFACFPSPTGDFQVALACSGQPVSYNVTAVSNADYANLTYPTGPMLTGATIPVTWDPVLNAEEYAVTLVTATVNGSFIFTGGVVPSTTTSLIVPTPSGGTLVFASVIAYRLCDKSASSSAGFHIAPVTP